MELHYIILSRRKKNEYWYYNGTLSDKEEHDIYEAARNGIPYDEIEGADAIKARIAEEFNSFKFIRKKVTPSDISFFLDELEERAIRGVKDLDSFLNYKDSMVIRRGDGSTVELSTEHGMISIKDSRKRGVRRMTVDHFLSYFQY